jgi:hypothetical protein
VPKEISTSDSKEEVIFNFKSVNTSRIQITEAALGEDSEESNDPSNSAFKDGNEDEFQIWEEESDKEIIYHILRKTYKRPTIDNESEESFMINLGPGGRGSFPARPRPMNSEHSW